jgi:hypothetical protein
VGSRTASQTSSEATTRPQSGCGFLGGQTATSSGGVQFIQMEVRLVVQTDFVDSSEAINRNIRLFPNRNCGYGF